jgi:thioredoxin 1
MPVSDLNETEFDTILLDQELVLVDFWAVWCRPCKALSPILDHVAEQNAGRLGFAKLNIDNFPHIAERFGIRNLPALVLFRKGQAVAQNAGSVSAADLQSWIDSRLDELA